MAKKKCIHRYKLKNIARKGNDPYYVYICTKQDCTHNIRVELIDGKLAECNRCGSPFVIKEAKLWNRNPKPIIKPHCDACTLPSKNGSSQARKEVEEVIGTLDIDGLLGDILPKGI